MSLIEGAGGSQRDYSCWFAEARLGRRDQSITELGLVQVGRETARANSPFHILLSIFHELFETYSDSKPRCVLAMSQGLDRKAKSSAMNRKSPQPWPIHQTWHSSTELALPRSTA